MFDIGFSEMFLIMVIALVVIGPERLPGVARKVGRFIGQAKRSFNHLKREISSELDTEELNRQLAKNNILSESKKVTQELKDLAAIDESDRSAVKEAVDSVKDIKDSIKKK